MRRILKGFCLLFGALLAWPNSYAQKVNYYEKYKDEYKGENSVILKNIERVIITNKKGEIGIETATEFSQLILEEKPYPAQGERVQYNSFMPMYDLKAETMIPKDGGGYSIKKVEKFFDIDQLSSSIFFDDTRATSFEYTGVVQGAVTRMSYKNKLNEPRFLSAFMLANYAPVIESEIVISYPNSVTLKLDRFHMDGYPYEEKHWKKGKVNYVSFRSVKNKKFDYETDAPTGRYFMPHVSYRIQDFINEKGEKEVMLNDVEDLHGWYSSLIKEYDTAVISEELSGIVDSLLSEDLTEIAKVKKVYNWVQDNIKYIAFEAGMQGFIPRSGNTICSNRYGDCKDMASIIHKMLEHAGIRSHLVWIGTRHIPYTYHQLPTPSVDNHMIAAYRYQDTILFLDATASYLPFGMPNGFIQGKEALVHEDSNSSYTLEPVPVVDASLNYKIDTFRLKYTDGLLKGTGFTRIGGLRRMYLVMRAGYAKESEKRKFYEKLLKTGNEDCLVEDIKETNLSNKDTSINLNYSLAISGYDKKYKDEVYINMNLNREGIPDKIKKDRTVPVEFDLKKLNKMAFILEIPEEYTVKFLPKNEKYDGNYLSYDINYTQKGNSLNCTIIMKTKSIYLETSEFEKYNQELNLLHKKYRESIILSK